jgi:hypothetical protein
VHLASRPASCRLDVGSEGRRRDDPWPQACSLRNAVSTPRSFPVRKQPGFGQAASLPPQASRYPSLGHPSGFPQASRYPSLGHPSGFPVVYRYPSRLPAGLTLAVRAAGETTRGRRLVACGMRSPLRVLSRSGSSPVSGRLQACPHRPVGTQAWVILQASHRPVGAQARVILQASQWSTGTQAGFLPAVFRRFRGNRGCPREPLNSWFPREAHG